jgi:hypothetical protein
MAENEVISILESSDIPLTRREVYERAGLEEKKDKIRFGRVLESDKRIVLVKDYDIFSINDAFRRGMGIEEYYYTLKNKKKRAMHNFYNKMKKDWIEKESKIIDEYVEKLGGKIHYPSIDELLVRLSRTKDSLMRKCIEKELDSRMKNAMKNVLWKIDRLESVKTPQNYED